MHRILAGNVVLDNDGIPLGGVHGQCSDAKACHDNQNRVKLFLRIPDDIELFQPKGKGKGGRKGKGKGKNNKVRGKSKGKGKDEANKGKISQFYSRSSSDRR